MIRLNAFIQVSDEHRAQVIDLAKQLVVASLKDEGCVAYDLFESTTRKDVLMICETWVDEPSLNAHSNSSHFQLLVPQIKELAKMKTEKFIF